MTNLVEPTFENSDELFVILCGLFCHLRRQERVKMEASILILIKQTVLQVKADTFS